jgi:adenine C2-methylase RlmN of 23S rRNA A2503 and tRNA A37
MTPNSALDKFRLQEIEQQLASELHAAREQTRGASTEEEKRNVLETYLLALQRYTEFAAKGIVPEEFLLQSGGSH